MSHAVRHSVARAKSESHIVERQISGPDGTLQVVRVNLKECPLSWLRVRAMVTERQFQAGELLQRDWELSGLEPRITMRWDPVRTARTGRTNDAPAPSERRINARNRFDGALQSAGPGLSDVLWRVVCAGEGLAAAERTMGWPARAGKLVLGFALDRVADYYRLP